MWFLTTPILNHFLSLVINYLLDSSQPSKARLGSYPCNSWSGTVLFLVSFVWREAGDTATGARCSQMRFLTIPILNHLLSRVINCLFNSSRLSTARLGPYPCNSRSGTVLFLARNNIRTLSGAMLFFFLSGVVGMLTGSMLMCS